MEIKQFRGEEIVPLYSRYCIFVDSPLKRLINLSFATFFWGTLQLTNGPFRVQYNMRRATFVTAIYVEMVGRKKKTPVHEASSSVLARANEWSLSR